MALDADDNSSQLSYLLEKSNYFFTGVFICEACFKIYVLEFRYYI